MGVADPLTHIDLEMHTLLMPVCLSAKYERARFTVASQWTCPVPFHLNYFLAYSYRVILRLLKFGLHAREFNIIYYNFNRR